MKSFNMGTLGDWVPVPNGQSVRFDLPAAGYRSPDFLVMADAFVSVIASNADGEDWLVGCGEGMLQIKFGMTEDMAVTIAGPEGCSIWIKTRVQTQVLAESGEASWTEIEPRRMSQSQKLTAMQLLMQRNAEKRMQALMIGIEERTRVLDERLTLAESLQPEPEPQVKPDA